MIDQKNTKSTSWVIGAVLLSAAYLIVLLRTAYVNEDAYITMRTVDNFVNGFGLTWNVAERVQSYTHPLWLFLIILPYYLSGNAFFTLIGISLILSCATFAVALLPFKRENFIVLVPFTILLFSKAFVDYSTSGLENPATHFLLALFLFVFLNRFETSEHNFRSILVMGILSGLATLNRMDAILLFAPALGFVVLRNLKTRTFGALVIGFLPFLAWEAFSVVYYGFPFPNSAYAKLNTGLTRADLFEWGMIYTLNSIHWDPITLFSIATVSGVIIFRGDIKEKAVLGGIVLYILYIFWIGGDFMSGRFFSGTLLASVILLAKHFPTVKPAEGFGIFILIALLAYSSPTPTFTSVDDASLNTGRTDSNGIYDLRSFYFQNSGLLHWRNNYLSPFHEWAFRGMEYRKQHKRYAIEGAIGYLGYFAGPEVFIIDPNALSDPLLARLKPIKEEHWLPGHLKREIPDGYIDTLRSGGNMFENHDLGLFYEKLWLIVRGPIFSKERAEAIWKMNTGQYDHLLESYESQY